jgi:NADH:ubiquinone oxidoreductase subunit F (NADH-binding)
MGMSIKEIVEDMGGGPSTKAKIKAVQTGGPSGGCIPSDMFDLPLDYDSLNKVGSIMGSGGMIVMDDNTCMVDVAKFFMNFLKDESCGKCFTCRKGTQRMYEILEDISNGKGTLDKLDLLEELALVVKDSTMCQLGQTASNPVLSTLKYFRDEYIEHLANHKCPGGVCKELITYSINEKCNGCMLCLKSCPEDAITGKKKELHVIETAKCIKCGACKSVCKFEAVDIF